MDLVLVIENHREIRENTSEILELAGYKVLTACNGEEGFAMAEKNIPDVILCDILMPETHGSNFLKLVKAEKETRHIPLIFLSADTAPLEVRKGLVQGADEYLCKPFSSEELLDAVERQLKHVVLK